MSQRRVAFSKPASNACASRGPIASKVIAALAKLQRQNVIDLAAWRQGQEQGDCE